MPLEVLFACPELLGEDRSLLHLMRPRSHGHCLPLLLLPLGQAACLLLLAADGRAILLSALAAGQYALQALCLVFAALVSSWVGWVGGEIAYIYLLQNHPQHLKQFKTFIIHT